MRTGAWARRLALLAWLFTLGDAAWGQPMTVASFNLRFDTPADGANAWPHRREGVKRLIREQGFDLVATQEGLAGQIADLAEMPGFAHVGVGRDDGRLAGEFSAIFYRRERFELLRTGDFWLSETPDQPSKGWDAGCCKRIATWARLRDRRNGKEFTVFSVHFDHQGEQARRESARLMLRKVGEIGGEAPVLCAGDFNSTPQTEQVAIMGSRLRDAFHASQTPPAGPVGTLNGFRTDVQATERIDYVFVSPAWKVLSYRVVVDEFDGRHPSDHHPVAAMLELP